MIVFLLKSESDLIFIVNVKCSRVKLQFVLLDVVPYVYKLYSD